jgi:hypothetical protein
MQIDSSGRISPASRIVESADTTAESVVARLTRLAAQTAQNKKVLKHPA